MLAEIITFRKQLTVRPEFKSQSGWTNALNAYMVEELERLRNTLSSITYNPDDLTQDQIETEAGDTTKKLSDAFNARALTLDNVVLPPAPNRVVDLDLSGNDLDIPQPTKEAFPNAFGRSFIIGLDDVFRELTRLDSRFQPATITKQESAMMDAMLNALYTICQRKGGESQKPSVAAGTLPTQESQTFKASVLK